MKNKLYKVAVFLTVFAVAVISPLYALDVSDALATAKENSSEYNAIELNLQSSMNNYVLQNSMKNGSAVNVNLGNSAVIQEGSFYFPTASVDVTFPTFADGLEISTNASVTSADKKQSGISVKDGASYSVGADIAYTKSIDLSGSGETDVSDRITLLQIDLNYDKSVLMFENGFYNYIIAIMQLESQIEQSLTSYEKAVAKYNNSIKLGEITEGSIADLKQQMELESTRINLESSQEQLENKKTEFAHSYGIEYEDFTVSQTPDLSFDYDENGNTSVYIDYLSMVEAKDNFDSASGNSSSLDFSAGLGSSYNLTKGKSTVLSDANASVTYTNGNLSLGTTISSTFDTGKFTKPVVTVSGSWGQSKTNSVNVQNLNIKYLNALSDYNDSLYNYQNDVNDLQNEIADYQIEVKQLQLQIDYDNKVLQAKQTLFDNGLCTKNDLDDAVFAVENDAKELTIQTLNGLVLQNRIKIAQL